MNGAERILAMFSGQPADCLPLLPITMMFAADQIGAPCGSMPADISLDERRANRFHGALRMRDKIAVKVEGADSGRKPEPAC